MAAKLPIFRRMAVSEAEFPSAGRSLPALVISPATDWFGAATTGLLKGQRRMNLEVTPFFFLFREAHLLVSLTLGFYSNEETRKLWPFDFHLSIGVSLSSGTSNSLRQIIKVTNTGETSFSFTGALHTYYNVPDIFEVTPFEILIFLILRRRSPHSLMLTYLTKSQRLILSVRER